MRLISILAALTFWGCDSSGNAPQTPTGSPSASQTTPIEAFVMKAVEAEEHRMDFYNDVKMDTAPWKAIEKEAKVALCKVPQDEQLTACSEVFKVLKRSGSIEKWRRPVEKMEDSAAQGRVFESDFSISHLRQLIDSSHPDIVDKACAGLGKQLHLLYTWRSHTFCL